MGFFRRKEKAPEPFVPAPLEGPALERELRYAELLHQQGRATERELAAIEAVLTGRPPGPDATVLRAELGTVVVWDGEVLAFYKTGQASAAIPPGNIESIRVESDTVHGIIASGTSAFNTKRDVVYLHVYQRGFGSLENAAFDAKLLPQVEALVATLRERSGVTG